MPEKLKVFAVFDIDGELKGRTEGMFWSGGVDDIPAGCLAVHREYGERGAFYVLVGFFAVPDDAIIPGGWDRYFGPPTFLERLSGAEPPAVTRLDSGVYVIRVKP